MRRMLLGLAFTLWLAPALSADPPFLWELQGAKARHYLIGSVHLLPDSAYPLHPLLDRAYLRTSALVLETDLAAVAAPKAQRRMLIAGRGTQPIAEEIGAALHERLQSQLARLELPQNLCDDFKPWLCALNLSVLAFQRAGMRADLGLDAHFFNRALKDDRALSWLEEPRTQILLFADMDRSMSLGFLTSVVDELESPEMGPEALIAHWRDNDHAGLTRLVAQMHKQYPALHARILADRNRAWMPQLKRLLASETPQLIVVGAAHFVGPEGLLALLAQEDLHPVPVKDAPAERRAALR